MRRRASYSLGRLPCLVLAWASAVVLTGHGAAEGQTRQATGRRSVTAYRPSISGPSQRLDMYFGRLGGSIGVETTSPWYGRGAGGGVATPPSLTASSGLGGLRGGRRTGPAAASARAATGLGAVDTREGSLLGYALRPSPGLGGGTGFLYTSAASSMYGPPRNVGLVSRFQAGAARAGPLGLGPVSGQRLSEAGYVDWVRPDIAIRPQGVLPGGSADASGGPSLETKLPLDELVRNSIDDRRAGYLGVGWQYFKQGRYQEALSRFRLADAVRLSLADSQARAEDMRARASVKLALIHAGIAAKQYAQAMNALGWLLTPDAQTGELPDPDFLIRITDVRDYYGAGAVYGTHLRDLEQFTIANARSAEARALYAYAVWADKGDPGAGGTALFQARVLASEPGVDAPWSNLYPAMQRAQAASGGEATAQGTGSSSSDAGSSSLPFELAETE